MAAKLLNTLGRLGIGIAVAGGVINSALYNGKSIWSIITSSAASAVFSLIKLKLKYYVT